MVGYGTETEAMAKGAHAVEEATTRIHQHLGTLQQQVDTILGHWKGDASTSFGNAHEAFAQQGRKLNDALRAMHEALVHTSRTYQAQEEQQSSQFNSIANQL